MAIFLNCSAPALMVLLRFGRRKPLFISNTIQSCENQQARCLDKMPKLFGLVGN